MLGGLSRVTDLIVIVVKKKKRALAALLAYGAV